MENTQKIANRYGLNLKITNINDSTDTATIDFANEVSIEITGDLVWATGGQKHGKLIGFKNPPEGTLKISTQVKNVALMHLLAGESLANTAKKVSFTDESSLGRYYRIEGDTVWQDEAGNICSETITAYKCLVKPNYSVTYSGDGDPVSVDVEFELAVDSNNKFLDFDYADGD